MIWWDLILSIGEGVGLLLIALLFTFVIMLGIATGWYLVTSLLGNPLDD